MTFTTLSFAAFFLVVLLVYALVPARLRLVLLLVASYFFFSCLGYPYLLLVLALVTLIAYLGGIMIFRSACVRARLRWFQGGVLALLAQLVWLKYLPFLAENFNELSKALGATFRVQTPGHLVAVGVSYFVFQGISYLADIYLELLDPERHLGRFALAMSFFPKLLQGPIERGGNILPQLQNLSRPTWDGLYAGVHLFIWGVFKKVVIADRLAGVVDPVYNDVHLYTGLPLLLATWLYAFQIFFDFSGYTDMALGLGRAFNIRLTQNFKAPYLANSIADFWRRWHISLSRWILDYLFRPLQLSFRGWPMLGPPAALLIAFLASGLWHGASWTFVVWGGIHGTYLSLSILTAKFRKKMVKALKVEKSKILNYWKICLTFNLVSFAWIFFRANSLDDGLYVAVQSVVGLPETISSEVWRQQFAQWKLVELALFMALVAVGGVLDRKVQSVDDGAFWLIQAPVWMRGVVYGVLCYLIAIHGADAQSFIYMQF
jgi:alginate O-acetyltransferase complex protein AlgI